MYTAINRSTKEVICLIEARSLREAKYIASQFKKSEQIKGTIKVFKK